MTLHEHETHFGFATVPRDEKARMVGAVFDSVASRYDLMNDVLSFGIHRLWKRIATGLSGVRPGDAVLDLAGGTGDLTQLLYRKTGPGGRIVLADINENMLSVGRSRLIDRGIVSGVDFVRADAENLPFASNGFHAIVIAFGLRNVTDKEAALRSMFRVCKPGGKLLVLEFSKPVLPGLQPLYDWYSFRVLPKLGGILAQDSASYAYLAESIRMHPDQETLKAMISRAGFEDCRYHNLSGGIVALHIAHKY